MRGGARTRLLLALALIASAALACQTEAPTPAPRVALSVGASSPVEPLLADLIDGYRRHAPYVTVAPEIGDGPLVLDGLRGGRFSGALFTTPTGLAPDGFWSQPVAVDALAIIVHPSNPLTATTLGALRDLFAGRTNAWPAVQGETLPVEVVSREDGASTRALFERRVMGDQRVTRTALVLSGSRDVLDYVAGHPAAIGYVSLGWVDGRVRALALDGVAPSPESARAQTYALITPVYFVSLTEPQGELREFYRYVISADGQAVVGERYGPVQ